MEGLESLRVVADPLLECRAGAIPPRQHHTGLRPRQHPRNGAQVRDLLGLLARRGPAADVECADFRQRCRRGEVLDEPGRLVHELRVRGTGKGRYLVHVLVRLFRFVTETLDVEQRRLDGCREKRLQIAFGDNGFRVLGGDDLALLGDTQRTLHRTRRLGEDRVVARAATTTDRATAAVEQTQADTRLLGRLDEVELTAIERPVGGHVPAVLVRIRVPEHDLLHPGLRIDEVTVERQIERSEQRFGALLEIFDRLEQRDDPHRRDQLAVVVDVDQACLFEQDHRLQHVADRGTHRDDVVRYRLRAECRDGDSGSAHDVEFLARELRQVRVAPGERTACLELRRQHRHPVLLGQRQVVGCDACPCQQLGDDLFVHVGVLPHVETGQIESERPDALTQAQETVVGDGVVVVLAERFVDDVELGEKFGGVGIGRLAVDEVEILLLQHVRAEQRLRRRDESRTNVLECQPEWLVGCRIVCVDTRELDEPPAGLDQPRRHAQLLTEQTEFGQVVSDRGARREGRRQRDHIAGHIRVAVTVAADPRAHPQDRLVGQARVGVRRLQCRPHRRIDLRHDVEERGVVVAQAGADLVLDGETFETDECRLPQRQDLALDRLNDLGVLVGGEVGASAKAHELGDAVLCVEDGATSGLGRMGGDHRDNRRVGERRSHLRVGQVCGRELRVGGRKAALLWRIARTHVNGTPTLTVDVLGEIRQKREVTECTDDRHRGVDVEIDEHVGEIISVDLGASDFESRDARSFDQIENLGARVLSDRVTEKTAKQPDVFTQRFGEGTPLVVNGDQIIDGRRWTPGRGTVGRIG